MTNNLFDWGPVQKTRRNHALEHATLQILAEDYPLLKAAGLSDPNGFWVVGDVSTEVLAKAVLEGQERLNNGEAKLAVHPNCGTNLVTSGVLAGTAAWLGMIFVGRSIQKKFQRLPFVILMSIGGLLLAQPLGPLLQARVTTDANLGTLQVREIRRFERNGIPSHRITTVG
jgi:hypothetical protein